MPWQIIRMHDFTYTKPVTQWLSANFEAFKDDYENETIPNLTFCDSCPSRCLYEENHYCKNSWCSKECPRARTN